MCVWGGRSDNPCPRRNQDLSELLWAGKEVTWRPHLTRYRSVFPQGPREPGLSPASPPPPGCSRRGWLHWSPQQVLSSRLWSRPDSRPPCRPCAWRRPGILRLHLCGCPLATQEAEGWPQGWVHRVQVQTLTLPPGTSLASPGEDTGINSPASQVLPSPSRTLSSQLLMEPMSLQRLVLLLALGHWEGPALAL